MSGINGTSVAISGSMTRIRIRTSGIAAAPGMALLLVGSLLALLALLGLAAFVGLTTWHAPKNVMGAHVNGMFLPPPPAMAGRDLWTPVVSGLRDRARRGQTFLGEIYRDRSYRPFWVTPLSLNDGGRSLLAHLAGPDREEWRGDEHRLTEIGHLYRLAFPESLPPDPHAVAELDWVLSKAYVKYARGLLDGRAPWARTEEDWYLPGERADTAGIFQQLEAMGAPAALDRFLTSHEAYTSLRDALGEYRAIVRAGGWATVGGGAALRLGDRSPRVRALRRRLHVTQDLPSAGDSQSFDEDVERAVRRFQARHGLTEDGSVGARTLQALNVPVEDRVRQLQVNLERRRWLPSDLGDEFLWINIPEFRLRIIRHHREVLSMPVVVGAPGSPTPSFGERLDRAVVNPSWYVPESIAVNELAPKAARDPDYLTNANFDLLDERGELVASQNLRPDLLAAGLHRLRRRPGPENDLGRIKFLLPNRFNVYLHDTPSRNLFARTSRAFSHGCIRVGEPLELAKYLFAERFTELERDLIAGREREMRLEEPVPVYIVYFTAFRGEDGVVHFRDDIYARDEGLLRALSGRAVRATADAGARRSSTDTAP